MFQIRIQIEIRLRCPFRTFPCVSAPKQLAIKLRMGAGVEGIPLVHAQCVLGEPLSDRDLWIAEQIAPTLVEKGLIFVGLDVIGDYLTEINVTSPTCVREIDNAQGTAIGDRLMAAIDTRLSQ